MSQVNVATNLTAEIKQADWVDHRGVLPGILDNPIKGFYRHAMLCGAGLMISLNDGGKTVFRIPLDELFKLAEAHEPKLCPPRSAAVPAAAAATAIAGAKPATTLEHTAAQPPVPPQPGAPKTT